MEVLRARAPAGWPWPLLALLCAPLHAEAPAAAPSAPPSASASSSTAAIEAFVAAARTRLPSERINHYGVRTLGSSEAVFRRLLPVLLDGSKTGTFALEDPSRPGDHWVVTHFDGTPALLWRVESIEVVPFGEISAAHIQLEGPGLRQLPAWRQVHLAAWKESLQGLDAGQIGRTPVYVQRFTVLYAPADGAGFATRP